jgi:hypothetical protein
VLEKLMCEGVNYGKDSVPTQAAVCNENKVQAIPALIKFGAKKE